MRVVVARYSDEQWAKAIMLGIGAVLAIRWLANPERQLPAWRRAILKCARAHVEARTPYQWGGGHSPGTWGLDCSGLVINCTAMAGIDMRGWDSQRMWNELSHVEFPQPADLALYSPRHVVFVEKFDPSTGIAHIIGSQGGGPSTTSRQVADSQGACVQRVDTHLYRSGFLGFATIEAFAAGATAARASNYQDQYG
jgi:hypothetical protein